MDDLDRSVNLPLKIGVLSYYHKDGRTLLLLKDKPGHYMHGCYVAPGGKRLPNESLETAAIRETAEETGVVPTDPKLKGFLHFPDFGDSPFGCEWLCFVYVFEEFSGKLFERGPEGPVVFVNVSEIVSLPMYPGDKLFTPYVFSPGLFSAKLHYSGQTLVNHVIKPF